MQYLNNLKQDEKDIRSLKDRSKIIFIFFLILSFLGIFKILQLTILDANLYIDDADKNRIIEKPIYPARGLIKLQNGKIIAENIVTKDLFLSLIHI